MPKKLRALDLLLQQGLVENEKDATARILAGEVYAGTRRVQSKAEMIDKDTVLRVKGAGNPYFSKGGLKLQGAIHDFGITVRDRVCIDAGASTGGFTDCLVRHGAALVYAVDVGYGQLMGALRQDPHVVNLEKTNISDEKLLTLSPRPTLGSVDLSYLSLRLGIPAFAEVLHHDGELMCLVKPLFETEDTAARRSGVLSDDAYLPILRDLIRDINQMPSAAVRNVTYSPVTGNTGTREFFLHVVLSTAPQTAPDLDRAAAEAVEKVLSLDLYEKKE